MNKMQPIVRKALIGPMLLFLLLGVYLGARQLVGNFYEVIPGTLYRAAQVTPASLSHYKKYFGIRTVINLRGANPGADWYDAELKASDELGLTHIDFAMKASQPLPQSRAAELIALMRTAPKPILVHCQAGADRTGLAAALFLAAIGRADEAAAERQLSLRFGHIGIPFLSAAYPMDESWETLAPWLGVTVNLMEDKL